MMQAGHDQGGYSVSQNRSCAAPMPPARAHPGGRPGPAPPSAPPEATVPHSQPPPPTPRPPPPGPRPAPDPASPGSAAPPARRRAALRGLERCPVALERGSQELERVPRALRRGPRRLRRVSGAPSAGPAARGRSPDRRFGLPRKLKSKRPSSARLVCASGALVRRGVARDRRFGADAPVRRTGCPGPPRRRFSRSERANAEPVHRARHTASRSGRELSPSCGLLSPNAAAVAPSANTAASCWAVVSAESDPARQFSARSASSSRGPHQRARDGRPDPMVGGRLPAIVSAGPIVGTGRTA